MGEKVDGRPIALKAVRGRGGRQTVEKFLGQRALFPNALLILLIDSEGPISQGTSVWEFIKARHGFDRPAWADESHVYLSHVYLMVQCIETWLVADPDALANHYESGFKKEKLPKRTNLEDEPKDDVLRKLGEAIGGKDTVYPHGDSAKIIARIDPERLTKLHHAKRLQEGLREAIEALARNS